MLVIPYAVVATGIFCLLSLLILALLFVVPGLERRRRLVRNGARLALRLIGMRVVVLHPERLPDGPCVVVANHASYIDGVVMTAALPPRFAFVIKREMDAVPLANLLLRRIGAEFVERGRTGRGARDARRLLKAARNAVSMVFFPEGTFGDAPGLLRFHAGAFVFAVRAGLPVSPVALRGTRRALPQHPPLPWPSRIEVEILPALEVPDGEVEAAVHRLRDEARAAILERCGEPEGAQKN
ncbi:MAG: lysophospholipid acyltransferase family protein [Steroidobacteraceae bacterium]